MGYQKGVTKIELNEYKAVWAMKSACKYSILYLSNFFVAWSSKLLVGFFFVWVVVGEGRVDMTLLLALILIAIVFENVNI